MRRLSNTFLDGGRRCAHPSRPSATLCNGRGARRTRRRRDQVTQAAHGASRLSNAQRHARTPAHAHAHARARRRHPRASQQASIIAEKGTRGAKRRLQHCAALASTGNCAETARPGMQTGHARTAEAPQWCPQWCPRVAASPPLLLPPPARPPSPSPFSPSSPAHTACPARASAAPPQGSARAAAGRKRPGGSQQGNPRASPAAPGMACLHAHHSHHTAAKILRFRARPSASIMPLLSRSRHPFLEIEPRRPLPAAAAAAAACCCSSCSCSSSVSSSTTSSISHHTTTARSADDSMHGWNGNVESSDAARESPRRASDVVAVVALALAHLQQGQGPSLLVRSWSRLHRIDRVWHRIAARGPFPSTP
ncbi:hypothetical protein EJ04DRAFT_520294 [Polyplosphaeria fusca]|uniref:Uncharacterized protein n=1 Tax=Polyplosphaeria fusca TaxID=682080 RepID=A0A9P4V6L7_9PLEO|nr:hypothetical protein EJ04DRAFT_520294 [Polyplosphaeria fusca]